MRRLLFLPAIALSVLPTAAWSAAFLSRNPDRSFGTGAAVADVFLVAIAFIYVRRAMRTGYAFTGLAWVDRRESPGVFRAALTLTLIGASVLFVALAVVSVQTLTHL